MARKLLLPLVAVIIIVAMVIPGCGTVEPPPVEGEEVPYQDFIVAEYDDRELGDFADEIEARMANLDAWYTAHNHFWVATGPMYLDAVSFTPKSITLKKFADYYADGDKWLFLMGLNATGLPEKGAWVEVVTIEREPTPAQAITRLQIGNIDLYAFGLSDPDLFAIVQGDEDLDYKESLGSYNELTLNPVGPVTVIEGEDWFNPFGIAEVREALHWAIDRSFIKGTVLGGLGVERWLCISTAGGEASRYPALIATIEAHYAYSSAAADAAIEAAMLAISGVTRDAGTGKYSYNAELVDVTILVRTEDERKQLGEYVAVVLEDLGFTVTIQYGTSSELSPIWTGEPADGLWNAYTGGWVTTVTPRDEGDNAAFFGTDLGAPYMGPLWVAYGHAMDWFLDAEKLWNYDFSTMVEREALIGTNLWGFQENAVRLFLVDRLSFSPFRKGLNLAADAFGGVYGSWMWAYTLHWQDESGQPDPDNDATVKIATTDILTNPWNPVAGTNWVYDMFPIRATGDAGHGVDTNDGIRWAGVFEKADVFAATGLPIGLMYEAPDPEAWCTLTFETDPIVAPDEAWVGWDVATKTPITVAEKIAADPTWDPEAARMSRTYYPEGTFDIKIHDGSTLSLADFLYGYIIPFERGQDEGMIYDPAYTSQYNAFVSVFKGVKFITDEPGYDLVVEYWSDVWNLDAEFCVTHMFPVYSQGPGMWHTLALAIMAEDDGKCAFGQAKAVDPIVWTNYVGTGKAILADYLDLFV